MNKKSLTITAFALFSLFFGAGNLILPPFLGFKSGEQWWLVTLGFCVSAVLAPILGILAHARLQGTLSDFAKKMSPGFGLIYACLVYAIAIALPSPRTASVTHEMAVQPFFGSSSLLTSLIYFILVYLFAINRSKVLDMLGKLLTPGILVILLLIIISAISTLEFNFAPSGYASPFSHGILEGYQTFDAIGAVVVGAVIIVSVNLKETRASYDEKKRLIRKAGLWAGLGLFVVYSGLILSGALFGGSFDPNISRTSLLSGISIKTLGNTASIFLSILVSLACFTTAVGIVTGTSDFVKSQFKGSVLAYRTTALAGCVLGVLIGQLNVGHIIMVAVPALMFIYPITIVLIILNVLPEKFAPTKVFQSVVLVTLLFSIPDFLGSIGQGNMVAPYNEWIPLSQFQMGWVLPALVALIVGNVVNTDKSR